MATAAQRASALRLRAAAADALGLYDLARDDRIEAGDDTPSAKPAPALYATLVGDFTLFVGGSLVDVDSWTNRRAGTLMRVLVAHRGRPIHRTQLVDWLWESHPMRGERSFGAAVSVIRRALAAAGTPRDTLCRVDDRYVITPTPRTDVDEFEHELRWSTAALGARRFDVARVRLERAQQSFGSGAVLPNDGEAPWLREPRAQVADLRAAAARMLAKLARAARS
ncbi:MAG TPA: hypothetical protein VHC63_14940 [Acidimicrobiales bacterium]|nr:hypothetical protein [Acidimicrobiales bacterium]